jgi:hypothetical protein
MYSAMNRTFVVISIALLSSLYPSCKEAPNKTASETTVAETEDDIIEIAHSVGVYDLLEDPAYAEKAKELDLKCPNLNDARISGTDRDVAMEAWISLNQQIGQHLMEKSFNWNTATEKMKIRHRFYFHKDGTIDSYYYNVMDKSISPEIRAAYGDAVSEIIQEHRIAIQRDIAFAQCGKMAFQVL